MSTMLKASFAGRFAFLHVPAALALLAASAGTAHSQQGVSIVRGTIGDEQQGVLPGVTVVATHDDSGRFQQTVTGASGVYLISNLLPGPYTLTAELAGFNRFVREGVTLEVGVTTTIDVTMSIGALEETVTVAGEAPLVDLSSSQVGGNVSEEELLDLPSSTRNFTGFVALLPGVQIVPSASPNSANLRINGQDGSGVLFLMDGGNNNDDLRGGSAGAQAKTGLEAIQEFQIITNQFDAEYSSAIAGVVNAVTKSGSNQVSGSAFGYFTESGLTAQDFFARQSGLEKVDGARRQAGGTIGGPIVEDKAHFFFSYERQNIDAADSRSYSTRPDLNFVTTQKAHFNNYLARVDHQVSANHNWGLRFLWDHQPTTDDPVGMATAETLSIEKDNDITTVGTWNWVVGNTGLNTLRGSFTHERPHWGHADYFANGFNQDQLPPTIRLASGINTRASDFALDRTMRSYQVDDVFSWFVPTATGSHDLKFGFQYNLSDHVRIDQIAMNGVFQLATDRDFREGDYSTYPERLIIRVPRPDMPESSVHSFGMFAQDKWQPRANLTLSLGVRYDVQVAPIDSGRDNPLFSEVGAGHRPVDANNVAPRLGFAYDLGGDSVFRGGYGLFYERLWVNRFENFVRRGVFANSFQAEFPLDDADPGPALGLRPTHPLLADGPVLDRDLLATFIAGTTTQRNLGSVWLDTPERPIAYQHQATVGYERQMGPRLSVSIDYVRMEGRDLPLRYNLNPRLRMGTNRTDPVRRTPIGYGNVGDVAGALGLPPFSSNVFIIENVASSRYDGLNLALEKRFSGFWGGRVSYALGRARSNNDGNVINEENVFQAGAERNLDRLWGPSPYDRRHVLSLSGRVEIPGTGGVTASAVARYMSGTPFTIHDSRFDLDRNGILVDPLPAGAYSGVGENALTVENAGGLRGAYGPAYFQLDCRIGYRLRPSDTRTLDLFAEIFNATNQVNFANPTGDMRLGSFLNPTVLQGGGNPRQLQFGVRYGF